MTAREGLLTSVSCQNNIGSLQYLSDSRFLPGPQLSPQILDFPFQIAPLAFVTSLLHFILSMHLMFFIMTVIKHSLTDGPKSYLNT